MSNRCDKRVDGEYDRPLPERIEKPTEADYERLKTLLDKYSATGESILERRGRPPRVEVTRTEQLLISGLQLFPLKEGQKVRIFLMMDTEEQMWKMMDFMASNQTASADELMSQAIKITGGLN